MIGYHRTAEMVYRCFIHITSVPVHSHGTWSQETGNSRRHALDLAPDRMQPPHLDALAPAELLQ